MSTVGNKIDDYARAHAKELKREEAKAGKSFTKYDIAQLMLAKGALSEKDYSSWMNSREGVDALRLSQSQQMALKTGNIWKFAGSGGQDSYLQSLADTDPFGIEISTENKKFDYKDSVEQNKVRAHIKSLPEVEMGYTEIMNSIKFQKMSREEKTQFLLQETRRMFDEAREKEDKETMKATLIQGLGLTFAMTDEKLGIKDVKEFVKEFSGLNAVVDIIDKWVEDGNDANLSELERHWNGIKGGAEALDSLIGSAGITMTLILGLASKAAAAGGMGKAFSILTTGFFGVAGASTAIEGGIGFYGADTPDDAKSAGGDLAMGLLMLYGATKSAKAGYDNHIAAKNAHAEQIANARKTLGIDDGVELTAKSLWTSYRTMGHKLVREGSPKDHWTKINDAYKFLESEIGPIARIKTKIKETVKPSNVEVNQSANSTDKTFGKFKAKCDAARSTNQLEKLLYEADTIEKIDYILGLIKDCKINKAEINALTIIAKNSKNDIVFKNRCEKYRDVIKEMSELKNPDGTNQIEPWMFKDIITKVEESDLINPQKLFQAIKYANTHYIPGEKEDVILHYLNALKFFGNN